MSIDKREPSRDIVEFGQLMDRINKGISTYNSQRDDMVGGIMAGRCSTGAVQYFLGVVRRKPHYEVLAEMVSDMLSDTFGKYLESKDGRTVA